MMYGRVLERRRKALYMELAGSSGLSGRQLKD